MKKLKHTFMTLLALGISFGAQSRDFIKTDAEIQQLEDQANQSLCDVDKLWGHYLAIEDYTKALYWLEERGGQIKPACDLFGKVWDARYITAQLYHMGLGVPQDLDKAISLYEQYENFHNLVDHTDSKLILAEKNGMKIPEDLKNGAERGDVDMMVLLAKWYFQYDENNFPRDISFYTGKKYDEERYEKADYWIKKAAEAGNAYAQYEYAVSRSLSPIESFRAMKKSAEQGYPKAQFSLASRYYYGYGTIKDVELALKYAKLACENGTNIGCRLYNEIKFPEDKTR